MKQMNNSFRLPYGPFLMMAILFFVSAPVNHSFAREELDGLIEPSEEVEVSSQVPGIVQEILVERGDMVENGQIIARLKSEAEKSAVDLARARVDFGKRKVIRNEDLRKKKLISVHDKDEMETELKISELQLREAQEKLELRVIRAPVDGVVVERFLSPGEYTGDNPIMKIDRIDPLYVEVVVPVEQYGRIKLGMKALVKPENPIGGSYKAEVIIVDKFMDAASGTFGVRLNLPNPTYQLPPGLKCKVLLSH